MKEVKIEEIKVLLKNRIIKNSSKGFINNKGTQIGFYRTRNKRYMEDSYVDIARELM